MPYLFRKLLPCKVVEDLTISEKMMRVADAIDNLTKAVTELQELVSNLDERVSEIESK